MLVREFEKKDKCSGKRDNWVKTKTVKVKRSFYEEIGRKDERKIKVKQKIRSRSEWGCLVERFPHIKCE